MLTKQQLYETSTEELNEYKELKALNSQYGQPVREAINNELARRKYVNRWKSYRLDHLEAKSRAIRANLVG